MLKLVLFAPTDRSLYSRLLAELIVCEEGFVLGGIVARRMLSWKRIRGELRRDGPRLLRKVARKLVLGEEHTETAQPDSLAALAFLEGLRAPTLSRLARQHGVPYMKTIDHNQPVVEEALRAMAPDIIVFTGGGLIRKNILAVPTLGILNCHAGLLPQYRGMDVVEWPVLEAEDAVPQIGLTCHYMDKGVDTGPILTLRRMQVFPGDDFKTLRRRIEPEMVRLMMATLRGIEAGDVTPLEQADEDGRQYFVMHPRLKMYAERKLAQLSNSLRSLQ